MIDGMITDDKASSKVKEIKNFVKKYQWNDD
jgi:hypothetical protein